jgi:hypothetical protein
MDEKLKLITYCGLYCDLCSERGRIPKDAQALKESMAKEGYENWGNALEGFSGFWQFLNNLCEPDKACPGCRQGGGSPFCGIRKCAKKKGHDICVYCPDYPCHRIEALAKGYPTLISDGKRIKEIGLDKWLAEQKQRAATGFVYADIRREPYEVPED